MEKSRPDDGHERRDKGELADIALLLWQPNDVRHVCIVRHVKFVSIPSEPRSRSHAIVDLSDRRAMGPESMANINGSITTRW